MIDERLTFGIDLGIGSCGWAVLREATTTGDPGEIKALGSWCFDVPETDKERTPTNQIRRGHRLLRRVIRRRRQRMSELRHLFHQAGLLPSTDKAALWQRGLDPWALRHRGLDHPLTATEFAVALGHIAKRRGFQSAAKRKQANSTADDKKMLAALEATREKLGRYRSVGELFARDPAYAGRRRNRDDLYDRTASRDDLRHEVRQLFAAQRRLGASFATETLERQVTAIAFHQRPLQDSERLVGACPFEPAESRAARLAPSYERFRLLTRLINLKLQTAAGDRRLTAAELARMTADLGTTATLTGKRLRRLLALADGDRVAGIKPDDEARDIVAPTGEALAGTHALRKALGEPLWARCHDRPDQLDAVAHILSFFETAETIKDRLGQLDLDPEVRLALAAAVDSGGFARFRQAGHLSAKACRRLLPALAEGLRYDEACRRVGYDHTATGRFRQPDVATKAGFKTLLAEVADQIANPIARKALSEGLKQLWAMRNRWGLPGAIHIELARDVGNSLEKRQEIERNLDKTSRDRERQRDEVREALGITDVDGDTLLRYRLWKEQGGRCLYTDTEIKITQVAATDNSVQVDHILPWSRFGDDSFNNKTLCLAGANQRKKGRTPFEWFQHDKPPAEWERFTRAIESNKALRGFKKRNYLLKNADEAAEKFRSRNLNDTRYACRLLAEAVTLFYPPGQRQEKGGRRRVFTRPGALTAALRHAWGLEHLKKTPAGERTRDSRHHALDALAVAAVTEAQVQQLTRSYQQWEQRGLPRPLRQVEPPWPGFRADVKAAYDEILVARPERRRARGKGHDATVRQVVAADSGPVVYERKAVADLKPADLARVKDPERNGAIIDAVRAWIEAGRPAEAPPRSPRGDPIVKLRLATTKKPAVMVRGGTADRGDMVRVDVFSKPNRRGKTEWYLVPVYRHQVMDRKAWPEPPMLAVAQGKGETDWTVVGADFDFRFSLYHRSYVKVVTRQGEMIEGYFAGLDRSTAAIALSEPADSTSLRRGIGTRTLLSIEKYAVDRFGTRALITSEGRTWHGAVCTSPGRHD